MISDNMQIKFFQSVLNAMHHEVSMALNSVDRLLENDNFFSIDGFAAINTARFSLKRDLRLIEALFNAGCDPKVLYQKKEYYKINEFFTNITNGLNDTFTDNGRAIILFSSKIDDRRCFYINPYEFEHMLYAVLYCLFDCCSAPEECQEIKIKITEKSYTDGFYYISIYSEGKKPSPGILSVIESKPSPFFNPSELNILNIWEAKKSVASLNGDLSYERTGSVNKFTLKIPRKNVSPQCEASSFHETAASNREILMRFSAEYSGRTATHAPDTGYIRLYFNGILEKNPYAAPALSMKEIPDEVHDILRILNNGGFSAYIVGGAVRDLLCRTAPEDFDIASSASCDDICKLFSDYTVIKTGERFGTVTVIVNSKSYEITSFRRDGEYKNGRSPEEVFFTNDINEDLKRRDFTINAMALSANGKLIDLFGGQKDIKSKIIKTVGNPDERFAEDALRILRALRFCSVTGFETEQETKISLIKNKALLSKISAERITAELKKLLCGKNVFNVLFEYKEIFAVIIPELENCFFFNQNNPHHIYDVYTHSVVALKNAPDDFIIRLALLLHDIGKPFCKTEGADGYYHFKGHAQKSAELGEKILKGLKLDNKTINSVVSLIKYHSEEYAADKTSVKMLLRDLGEELTAKLFYLKLADESAKADFPTQRYKNVLKLQEILREIIDKKECYCEKMLNINGNILKETGFCGKEIKEAEKKLLDAVISGEIKNNTEELKEYAEKLRNKK